jgi:hypothetical protein
MLALTKRSQIAQTSAMSAQMGLVLEAQGVFRSNIFFGPIDENKVQAVCWCLLAVCTEKLVC